MQHYYNVNFCIRRHDAIPTGAWVACEIDGIDYLIFRPKNDYILIGSRDLSRFGSLAHVDRAAKQLAAIVISGANFGGNFDALFGVYYWGRIFIDGRTTPSLDWIATRLGACYLPTESILINRNYCKSCNEEARLYEQGEDYFLAVDSTAHPVYITRMGNYVYAIGCKTYSPLPTVTLTSGDIPLTRLLRHAGYDAELGESISMYKIEVIPRFGSTLNAIKDIFDSCLPSEYGAPFEFVSVSDKHHTCIDGVSLYTGQDTDELFLHSIVGRVFAGLPFVGNIPCEEGQEESEVGIESEIVDDEVEEQPICVNSTHYASNVVYKGYNSYHASHRRNLFENTYLGDDPSIFRVGIELEVECTSDENCTALKENFNSNFMLMERDGSLTSRGIEFISIPLAPSDARSVDFWKPLCEELGKRAKSWDTSTCGLHVHIGRDAFGGNDTERDDTIFKLLYLYYGLGLKSHRRNTRVFGRSAIYSDENPDLPLMKASVTLGSECLKVNSVKNKVKDEYEMAFSRSRYVDVNLSNEATIEFRKGKGSLSPQRIAGIVDWCLIMVEYARYTEIDDISLSNFFDYVESNARDYTRGLYI